MSDIEYEPTEQEKNFIQSNHELLRDIVCTTRGYIADGDGDGLLLLARVLHTAAQIIVGMVKDQAVIVKKGGLTVEDCIKKH